MTSGVEKQAADYAGPMNTASGALSVTTTTAYVALHSEMKAGEYWDWSADGGDVYMVFGSDDTITADPTTTSTVSANAITVIGGAALDIPQLIPSGQTKPWRIPKGATHMAYIAATGTPTLRFHRSQEGTT